MQESSVQLFTQGDLTDFLLDRWNSLETELNRLGTDRLRQAESDKTCASLKAKYDLTIPAIIDCQIVEHGEVEPDREPSWMTVEERISYLEGLLVRPRTTYAIIRLVVDGNIDLLRFCPPKSPPLRPRGHILDNAVHFRCIRSGGADKKWMTNLEQNIRWIESLLGLSQPWVQTFNSALERLLVKPPQAIHSKACH